MSTIQIVGIAAAAVIVLLLIIALVVTRKGGGEGVDDAARSDSASFLDTSPSDTFAKLGRPEHVAPPPVEAPAATPAATPATHAVFMTATGVASSADGSLRLDWDQPEPTGATMAESGPVVDETAPAAVEAAPAAVEAAPAADESEATGELPAVTAETNGALPALAAVTSEPAAAEAEPASPAVGETEVFAAPQAAPETEAEDGPGWVAQAVGESEATSETGDEPETSDDLVPLSSIIVTTSTKMVDLRDPDVRRMLTELVTFEIDQATQFRTNGQSLDAVLQLTEAEKICRALGKHDTAREIRDMMRELKD